MPWKRKLRWLHPVLSQLNPGSTFQRHASTTQLRWLDFVGCDAIWDHFTVTREDKRQDYGEERLVCFGLVAADVVVMVYTERRKGLT